MLNANVRRKIRGALGPSRLCGVDFNVDSETKGQHRVDKAIKGGKLRKEGVRRFTHSWAV